MEISENGQKLIPYYFTDDNCIHNTQYYFVFLKSCKYNITKCLHTFMSNTVIVTCGEESVYHSEEPETPQVVGGVNVAQSLYF